MNKTRMLSLPGRLVAVAMFVCWIAPVAAHADARTGEAVVAGMVGSAQARVFSGPVHEGRTELIDLSEGSTVGETSRLITGKDGRLCVVLSPGAILCVAPQTELTFRELRHSADGLPKSESDLVRRIHIDLHKGRILVHAGAPTPSLDIKVQVPPGTVESSGGTFVVAQTDKETWAVISEEYDVTLKPLAGKAESLAQGKAASMYLESAEKGDVKDDESLLDSPARKFEVCNTFFQDLEPFIDDPLRFDRQGLGEYIGAAASAPFVGDAGVVTDVSPSFRPVSVATLKPIPSTGGGPEAGGRWDQQRIWSWYDEVGVIKGVNYVPRNAVNSTDMWLADTFDPDIIDEELGWAHDAGYTALRVQLQYVVWKDDPDGFLDRFDKFLKIADDHGLRVVPVLFDDMNMAGREPAVGKQPDPVPGVNNSQWTASPGSSAVKDRDAWVNLKEYLTAVIKKFRKDDRVLYWDLYNTAGNDDLWEQSLPLMDQAFLWARDVDPKQPIAVAAWTKYGSAMSARKLERSDIITFQSFDDPKQVEALIMLLRKYDRPIVCADWLMRQRDNRFDNMLPLFAVNRVGWFNHGLVNGKTQQWIQQPQFKRDDNPDLWQHDVLKSDGKAYDAKEIELIQGFRYLEGP